MKSPVQGILSACLLSGACSHPPPPTPAKASPPSDAGSCPPLDVPLGKPVTLLSDAVMPQLSCPDGARAVPGGSVRTDNGGPAINGAGETRQEPAVTIRVEPFCLDKMEVTTDAFALPDKTPEAPRLPAEVSYQTAEQYCSSRGARLPTQAEWLAAVFASSSTRFPWGSEIVSEGVCWRKPEGSPPCSVGTNRLDVTGEGIFDLVANANEWTASDAEGRTKIVGVPRDRCNAPLLFLDLRLSLERSIDDTSTLSGFRCVRPPE